MGHREEAKKLYDEGLSLPDISERLGVKYDTVKKWKQRDNWDGRKGTGTKGTKPKPEPETRTKPPPKQDRGAELGEALNDAQKLFCEIFVRNRNATMAYMQSHPGCTYASASVLGYESLRNIKLAAYIDYLRDLKAEAIRLCPDDLVERYMRIAFADMSDFADWGYDGQRNRLAAMPSTLIDGTLICEISASDKGFKIKLEDRQKALDWLAGWFNMNPMDRHKIEYDKKRLEIDGELQSAKIDQLRAATGKINGVVDESKASQQTQAIADLINCPSGSRSLDDFMPGGDNGDTLCASDDSAD